MIKSVAITAFVLVALLAMTYVGDASANNWVRCKNIVTGDVQMIRGQMCPPGWAPV